MFAHFWVSHSIQGFRKRGTSLGANLPPPRVLKGQNYAGSNRVHLKISARKWHISFDAARFLLKFQMQPPWSKLWSRWYLSPLSLRVMALAMDSRSRPFIRHLWKKAQHFPIYIKIQNLFPRVWQLFDYIYLNVCSVGRMNSYLLDIGPCNFAKINISEHFSYMGIFKYLFV